MGTIIAPSLCALRFHFIYDRQELSKYCNFEFSSKENSRRKDAYVLDINRPLTYILFGFQIVIGAIIVSFYHF